MNYIQIPVTTLETLIEGLQSAVNVCYNVDYTSDETEKSPCFANGYSRATMQSVIQDLNRLKSQSD